MNELPSGWARAELGDVVAPLSDGRLIHQGWSPQCLREPSDSNEVWGVLKTTSIQPGRFLEEHNKRLPDSVKPRPLVEVSAGDVLITCAGPRSRCGVACLVRSTRPRLLMSGKMYRFRFDGQHIDARFIEAYLLSSEAWDAIDRMKTGGSDSGLNLTHERFRGLEVPIAPLAEQKRIVTAIEEAFSKLDAGEAGLEKVRQLLKRMREAVLETAVRGPLHPESWRLAALRELIREPLRNGKSALRESGSDGVPTFTLTAVTTGDFSERNIKRTVADPGKVENLWVQTGDILVQRSNAPLLVGTTRMYRGAPDVAIFPDLIIRIRTRPELVPDWLELFMTAPTTRRLVQNGAQGLSSSMPKISQPFLESLQIPLPPVEEQRQIVRKVERQVSFIEAAERAVSAALLRSAALRRSILKAAFEGKLVPRDSTDEPASVLLEKIHAERLASDASRPKRSRTKVSK